MEVMPTFAVGVVHDLANSMSLILAYSNLLSEMVPEGDECHHMVQQIEQAGRQCYRLIGKLLIFARKQPSV